MDESPGWAAIDAALARLYGNETPIHWGTVHRWTLGGPDPLDGISAYPRTEPVPHWHMVSYGMTELYSKESDNPDESGWGFEFTFRVARAPDEDTPPVWAANVLQNLGRYVFNSGNWFEPGHHMNVNGPIRAEDENCLLHAVAFVEDAELGEIDTPHGRVQFLQVVGLTADEYEATRQWDTLGLLGALEPKTPLHVTDIARRSLLDDPHVAATFREGIERDGSSTGLLLITTAHWTLEPAATTLRLGALQTTGIAQALRGRLPYGRDLVLRTDDTSVTFEPSDTFSIREHDGDSLVITLPPAALNELVAVLRPKAGRHTIPSAPGLVIEIVPTQMRDQYGQQTGQTIG
ncbi:suppressor of fused domain protein [Spirillospora sp. CA-294931]|uniref:suppressor of fused domain protein n=1 Tax=Spirillospora sp. CA-294931 TaxID=3240042 RepID=UPI003D9365C2